MKPIAIHNGIGWNVKWIEYCRSRNIPFKAVCCYDSDIIEQIRDCSALMWHFYHTNPIDILMARNVLNAAEMMGLKVYPDFYENWHFDDKLSQKYLLEALNLPAAPSWAFFDEKEALEFGEHCTLPIVAKLRHGAGSYNVRLLKTRSDIRRYIKRMFGRGFSPAPAPLADVKTKLKVAAAKGGLAGIVRRLKKAPNFFRVVHYAKKYFGNEKGYVYFQKYIPGNLCDYRIKVVGDIAWGLRRMVRDNDFRASGGGMLDCDYKKIPADMIRMAFNAADKLRMQSIAFDIVLENNEIPWIVEISYAFGLDADQCNGYWDRNIKRHNSVFDPTAFIIETFLKKLTSYAE